MYSLVRQNDRFCCVEDGLFVDSNSLVRSLFSPKWYASTWRLPSHTEKKTWHGFLKTGRIDDPRLNQKIEQSWRRCLHAAVEPTKGVCEKFISVKEVAHRSEMLADLAKPIMDTLYHCVKGSEFVIVLVDQEGYILKTIGGLKELKQAEKVQFGPGADWSEESVGTNAIGTALALGHPVQVTGPEHFCETHHLWTCSAAPIRTQNGKTIGFLDISGPRERATAHQLGLIVAASRAIEDRLCLDESYGKLCDINQYLEAVLNSVSEGIIAVNGQGLITGINEVAASTLNLAPRDVIGKSIQASIQHDGRMQNFFNTKAAGFTKEEVVVKLPDSRGTRIATANPVFSEKDDARSNAGFVLTFPPAKKISSPSPPAKGSVVRFTFTDVIGESSAIRQSIEKAKRVARGPSTVLILGESGTGKELFAQAIHADSDYAAGPFITFNCGAIPRELIQSDLFGYVGGAFTGARRGGCAGKFETANGGTLFLDEIGEMPLEMQISLLRILTEDAVVRVGGDKAIPIDVRIIAATNKSLFDEMSKGRFREDLYYRLNVISIAVPPLRAREDDVILLANHWLETLCRKLNRPPKSLTPEAMDLLKRYKWPGNVRELVNTIEYAVNMATGRDIAIKQLPAYLHEAPSGTGQVNAGGIMTLKDLEKDAIKKALIHFDGNITKASKSLGIGRNTLYDKMNKYGIRQH